MRKFTVMLLIIFVTAFIGGSFSHLWAGEKANFHFDVKFDKNGKVVGVDRWDKKQGKMVPAETRTEVSGVKTVGTILMLKGEDPCVVIGGKNYCW